MKTLLKIILLLLPSLCVAQYHDAQWVFSQYNLDFRKNNDSIVVFTGRVMLPEPNLVADTVGHQGLLNYNYKNGERFIHIDKDSTWYNDSMYSTRDITRFEFFDHPKISFPNGNKSSTDQRRIFPGFVPLDSNNVRLYVIHYQNTTGEATFGALIYDDLELNRNNNYIVHNYKLGLDSVKDFTASLHPNPNKHWVIVHYYPQDEIRSYLADENGINQSPSFKLDLNANGIDTDIAGDWSYFQFKVSPDGKKILMHTWKRRVSNIYLLTLDPFTGSMKYITKFDEFASDEDIKRNDYYLYNFSPNSQFVYIQANKVLVQYDLSDLESQSIIDSRALVQSFDNNLSKLLNGEIATNFITGINSKMYLRNYEYRVPTNPDSSYRDFAIINRPDRRGVKSDFRSNELKHAYYNENLIDHYFINWNRMQFPGTMIGRSVSYCEGEDAYLNNVWEDRFVGTNFKWELLNLESNDTLLAAEINKYFAENPGIKDPFFSDATHNYEGKYYITWTDTLGYNRERIVNLYVDTLPKVEIVSTKLTGNCERERYRLEADNIVERYEYRWSTGETTPIIEVDKAGNYTLYVTSFQGCVDSSSIDIQFEDEELYLEILGGNKLCYGGELTLSANQDYNSYLWNTDETSKSIEINKTGRYILTVETIKGCTISDTIDITYHPKVQAQLKPTPTTICNGDSTLLESKYDVPYYSYEWNTGATTKSIYVNSSGTYKLIITDTRTGCLDSTEIAIKVEDNLQPTITGSNICSGESATLTALPNDPSYTYLWSNGESTPVIVVNQAGTYTVTVSKAGCVGTAEYTVNESPTPDFEIIGESIICNNEIATLTASEDFAEYLWSTNEITKEIEVTEAGTYTLTVTDTNGCSATESFTVDKYELSFDISEGSIDFGKVYITETKSDNTTIINNSGFEITLANGQTIADGQAYTFNYNFVPTQLGPFNNSIDISLTEPCDTVITIPITATVFARTTISTEDIYTQIGQTETVPVYLECEAELPSQEYTITTEIDRTAFFTNDSYIITRNQPINKTKTSIHNLTGTILLSDDLEYDITFPSYSFTNPYIEVIEQPGRVYIDSVCVFPLRNITTFDPTTLTINPNPASEVLNIDITTGIQGIMKLELVATDGRVIYTDEWTQSTKSKQMQLNTINIPSGLYQVRLITPYDAITKSVIVVE